MEKMGLDIFLYFVRIYLDGQEIHLVGRILFFWTNWVFRISLNKMHPTSIRHPSPRYAYDMRDSKISPGGMQDTHW